jgi:hypothetical protein
MMRLRRHILGLVTWLVFFGTSFAQETSKTSEIIPEHYPKNYFLFQANQTQPLGKSKSRFDLGTQGFGLNYSFYLAKRLIVGIHFKNRVLDKRDGQSLTLMTFGNHSQGVFRLYHPLYFLVGTEWNYTIPTLSTQLPVLKDPEYSTEIGVGLGGALWYFFTPKVLSELKITRWKGTKTSRLEGLEASLGIGLSL